VQALSLIFHLLSFRLLRTLQSPRSTLFPYTTLFRSGAAALARHCGAGDGGEEGFDFELLPVQAAELGLVAESFDVGFPGQCPLRSEEHTSEVQSRENLVCRLLLEKTK